MPTGRLQEGPARQGYRTGAGRAVPVRVAISHFGRNITGFDEGVIDPARRIP